MVQLFKCERKTVWALVAEERCYSLIFPLAKQYKTIPNILTTTYFIA